MQALKKNFNKAKGLWVEKLSKILQAHKTTHKNSTNETLFDLAFRVKAVILVDVGLPSFKFAHYNEQKNDKQM